MILHINDKLNMWSEWVARGRRVHGLGYPSQVAFMRLTPCSNHCAAPMLKVRKVRNLKHWRGFQPSQPLPNLPNLRPEQA